ncbi:hypothetical protein N7468_004128 [Penicillium chermesinum]|uniref:RING-type domain-containing protein n=1 Tax=Penicillium chermesinum TaxID=63820 RepID=A0A9W9P7R8_9EURO|nr:uncharacterized protein N7468_004128 [Penicillium chermesinum]KAJ5239509.1 hypothetical protein N7468_004128 [Penicillium chermesinum]
MSKGDKLQSLSYYSRKVKFCMYHHAQLSLMPDITHLHDVSELARFRQRIKEEALACCDDPCGVCFEALTVDTKFTILACHPGHRFHEACIIPWLQRQDTCPICRRVCIIR